MCFWFPMHQDIPDNPFYLPVWYYVRERFSAICGFPAQSYNYIFRNPPAHLPPDTPHQYEVCRYVHDLRPDSRFGNGDIPRLFPNCCEDNNFRSPPGKNSFLLEHGTKFLHITKHLPVPSPKCSHSLDMILHTPLKSLLSLFLPLPEEWQKLTAYLPEVFASLSPVMG